jgi:hypothetical protein
MFDSIHDMSQLTRLFHILWNSLGCGYCGGRVLRLCIVVVVELD